MVTVDGDDLNRGINLVYYKFFKPTNVICTLNDPKGRRTIKDFISKLPESVYPVGRLDRPTKGLILLTNDGAFTHQVLHPSHELQKYMRCKLMPKLARPPETTHNRFFLEDGPVQFPKVVAHTRTELTVTIAEGRNRIIRRAFAFFGYEVKNSCAPNWPIVLEGVKEGKIEPLTKKEFVPSRMH